LCSFVNKAIYAQSDSVPSGEHVVKESQENPLLNYLFAKYGIEKTEGIVLNIQRYEKEHQVKVMEAEAYNSAIHMIEDKIHTTNDVAMMQELERQKSRLISIVEVENAVVTL